METGQPLHLLPTMPMLFESLRECGWACTPFIFDEAQQYREIRLYLMLSLWILEKKA